MGSKSRLFLDDLASDTKPSFRATLWMHTSDHIASLSVGNRVKRVLIATFPLPGIPGIYDTYLASLCLKSLHQTRHCLVENYQVRAQFRGFRDCLFAIGGVATSLPTGVGLQQRSKSFAGPASWSSAIRICFATEALPRKRGGRVGHIGVVWREPEKGRPARGERSHTSCETLLRERKPLLQRQFRAKPIGHNRVNPVPSPKGY